jgi:hypothetical protein
MTTFFVHQGWQCPICKAVYSPTMPCCFTCVPQKTTVSSGTGPTDAPVCPHGCEDGWIHNTEPFRMVGDAGECVPEYEPCPKCGTGRKESK